MSALPPLPPPPANCVTCPIRSHTEYYRLQELDPTAFRAVPRETLVVRARRIILRQGEIPPKVFTLYSGWAFRFTLLPDGRRQILGFLLPGDLISLRALLGTSMSFSVQALTDVSLCSLDAAELRKAMLQPSVCEDLVRKYMDHCTVADARITDLGQRTALERVARLILELEGRLRARQLIDGNSFNFPLRQEHIGDALGLTSVHVSRTLTTMRELGAITLRRGSISLEDRRKLLELAGET